MARLPRLVVPHHPHHVVQAGNNGQPIFHDADDYVAFLGWLREAARQFRVAIHAYALLPRRLQLLASPSDETGLARMMQWVGRHYVPYFNTKYRRAGTLWQGRYRATVIEPEQYLLLNSRYIETLPVREGLVASPADYPWSSCPHHVGARSDPLISDHSCYWALGNTPFDRELAYKALLEQGVPVADTVMLDGAIQKGWPLGSPQFIAALAKQAKRRVLPAQRGRPRGVRTGSPSDFRD